MNALLLEVTFQMTMFLLLAIENAYFFSFLMNVLYNTTIQSIIAVPMFLVRILEIRT